MNAKIMFSAIPWTHALELLSQNQVDNEFCQIATRVFDRITEEKKKYVYLVKYKFGDKLIDQGIMPFENLIPASGSFVSSCSQLQLDLNYSKDPLGLVLNNHIEVYSENNSSPDITYNIPLNIIEKGDFFGLFGTLDYLSGQDNFQAHLKQNWHVVAGNASFEILFPFNNKTTFQATARTKVASVFTEENSYTEKNKMNFMKYYVNEVEPDWTTDIIYFPKHFFEGTNDHLKAYLYDIGWLQSSNLRNLSFENKIISDVLFKNSATLNHNDLFVSHLFSHIWKASLGEAYVLKPLETKKRKHILSGAFSLFEKQTEDTTFTPILLIYDKLDVNNKDWGLIHENSIPISLNYKTKKLKLLSDDIIALSQKLKNIFFEQMPDISITTDGGKDIGRVAEQHKLKKLIADRCSIDENQITFKKTHLSNFIIIRNQK
ncbi:MAG: hypothetical protein LBH12_03290 [Dysgonamonadaceae bacterium]|jgi:hypothetical protein|nr:hypothetical protein [Dysgonamonadaceae bacterium]